MRRRPVVLSSWLLAAVLALVTIGSAPVGSAPARADVSASAPTDLVSNAAAVTLPEASRTTEGREDSRWSSRYLLVMALLVAAVVLLAGRRTFGLRESDRGAAPAGRRSAARPRAPPLAV